jgi:hypothetical protein
MDAPGSFTIEKKGKKRVSAKTTGKDKARLSCLMSATASGVKLPVLCVVPRKKRIDGILFPEETVVIYETNGISWIILRKLKLKIILFLKVLSIQII